MPRCMAIPIQHNRPRSTLVDPPLRDYGIVITTFEGGGLGVVVNEVFLVIFGESYLPATGEW